MNLAPYIGLPYLPKGRTTRGLDCYGLVYVFYREVLGINLPDYLDTYESPTDRNDVAAAIGDNLVNWHPVEDLQYGDLLVFNILGLPVHTAIYLGANNFLHSFQRTDSCIERLNSISWQRRLVGAFRWQKN